MGQRSDVSKDIHPSVDSIPGEGTEAGGGGRVAAPGRGHSTCKGQG